MTAVTVPPDAGTGATGATGVRDAGARDAGARDAGSRGRPIAARLRALSSAVEQARTRPRRRFDVRRALLVIGSATMALGLVAIVLGWYGAAHSAYQFQEIPYLISGGLLGVALVAGGGFLFFAAWIVRLIEENRRHAARLGRTLDKLDAALRTMEEDRSAAIQAQAAARVESASQSQAASEPGAGYGTRRAQDRLHGAIGEGSW